MTYYTREIAMPATKREGFANFVQIIINRLEAGETQEALLGAVDLLNDIVCGAYDNAMTDSKGITAIAQEVQKKHVQETIEAAKRGYALGYDLGVDAEKKRMAAVLGLA
jgi:uncharacterized transporter YbjL